MTENCLNDEKIAAQMRDLEENLKEVRERIAEAAVRSGRKPEDITLLAATKTVSARVINRAIELGVDHIGENRVQELMDKYDALNLSGCSCQFIGHLQTNKVRYLIGKVDLIQSVDSLKLASEISSQSLKKGACTDLLIEVNIGGEESKSGVEPSMLGELYDQIAALPAVSVRGLMCIPPICDSQAEIMRYFSKMREYFVDITTKKSDNKRNDMILSMGMSADYYEAILCGATMVRVGSKLFGKREYR
ncbi:MAG: YggS family pyridoxal phosphate-dependent enzyme [Clostridia bacterium]|nr:YggS family pyridoxal phosphate-dependent enzyme [Clostridia bacterium]